MSTKRALTDEEIVERIAAARAREEEDRGSGLRAAKAFYDPINELVMIETTRGFRWGIPRARIPALRTASADDLVQLTMSPAGDGLHWETLDVQLSVPGLLVDALGAGTLAKELARRGGLSTSEAKAEAARRNGAKGGRPSSKSPRSHAGGYITDPKKGPSVHVVPSKTQPGKFVVKEAGKSQPLTRPATQAKSIEKAVPLAKQNKSEVVIHGRDGKIRDRDNYGHDAISSRDKKH
jgi:hypothetical protein